MKKFLLILVLLIGLIGLYPFIFGRSSLSSLSASDLSTDYTLIFHDEFDGYGPLDTTRWNYELGYVRNYEAQYYTPDNIYRQDGYLVIEARPADFLCPEYDPDNGNWRTSRERVEWTSGSVTTQHRFSFTYGRVEVCARIPVCPGAWPAIWLLGSDFPWPGNGEIDMLEYYQLDGQPTILANACWAGKTEDDTKWDDSYWPLEHFLKNSSPETWSSRFHVWRMDWDKEFIRLYLDDELLNEVPLKKTINGKAGSTGINPFHHPFYLLLNLALDTRVTPYDPSLFPMRYEIDYVRIYQRK